MRSWNVESLSYWIAMLYEAFEAGEIGESALLLGIRLAYDKATDV